GHYFVHDGRLTGVVQRLRRCIECLAHYPCCGVIEDAARQKRNDRRHERTLFRALIVIVF
ncbi:MAG: hypothetical protein WA851_25330, partial [Xanthobacteraceae bacterium]